MGQMPKFLVKAMDEMFDDGWTGSPHMMVAALSGQYRNTPTISSVAHYFRLLGTRGVLKKTGKNNAYTSASWCRV